MPRSRSSRTIRGKRKVCECGRRERHPAHEGAAIEKEIQLGHRERQWTLGLFSPQRRKTPPLQALHIQTEAGAIEVQHLRANPIAAHEEKDITTQRIPGEALRHQAAQTVEALAHVGGGAVRVDGDPAPRPSHRSRAISCAAVSTSTPSTRTPVASTMTTSRAASDVSAWRRRTGRNRASIAQRRKLTGATPSAAATARLPSPAASRARQ